MANKNTRLADALITLAGDEALLDVGRKAIEDELVEWRDASMFQLRNNGFTIKNKDGSDSVIIRFGPEVGLRMALLAIAKRLKEA